jgi:hypothetical protein
MSTMTTIRRTVRESSRIHTVLVIALALVALLAGVRFTGFTSHAHVGHAHADDPHASHVQADDQPRVIQSDGELQALAQDQVVTIGAHRPEIANLQQLTVEADLIVVGHVTGQGNTRELSPAVAQPADEPLAEPPADAAGHEAPRDLPSGETLTTIPGLPVTDFPIRVTRVLKGTGGAGDQVVVSQVGGQIELPTFPGGPQLKRTIHDSGDPLMEPGQQVLLFLTKGEEGTFGVVGGAQGRFTVDRQGRLQPIAAGTPVGRALGGKSVDQVATEARGTRP